MKVLAKFMNDDQLHEIADAFRILDNDHSGSLTLNDLEKGLRNAGIDLAGDEIRSIVYIGIVDNLDMEHTGRINYTEFLLATLDMK